MRPTFVGPLSPVPQVILDLVNEAFPLAVVAVFDVLVDVTPVVDCRFALYPKFDLSH